MYTLIRKQGCYKMELSQVICGLELMPCKGIEGQPSSKTPQQSMSHDQLYHCIFSMKDQLELTSWAVLKTRSIDIISTVPDLFLSIIEIASVMFQNHM